MLPPISTVEGNYSRFSCRMEALFRIPVASVGILTCLYSLMERGAANPASKAHNQNRAFACISWETLKYFPLHMHRKITSVLLPTLCCSRPVKSCTPETSESPSWTLNPIVISSVVYSCKASYPHSDTYFWICRHTEDYVWFGFVFVCCWMNLHYLF